MSNLLADMAAASRVRAQQLRAGASLGVLRDRALASPPPRPLALDRFCLIAEVKRASPSQGVLSADDDAIPFAVEQARRYAAGGASVISVLTEPSRFGGDLAHAAAVARELTTPVMRKDFLVDPAQVYEARTAGCSGVLLITRMLSDQALAGMLGAAGQCGLFVLLEAFDAADLARTTRALDDLPAALRNARAESPRLLLGLNTRDLATLKIDADALARLAGEFPPGYPRIAESGLATPADAAAAARLGYTGALVGAALMRAADPARLVADMLAAARQEQAS